jgi:hypothetical protein
MWFIVNLIFTTINHPQLINTKKNSHINISISHKEIARARIGEILLLMENEWYFSKILDFSMFKKHS